MSKTIVAAASLVVLLAFPTVAAAQRNTTVGVGAGAVAGAIVAGPVGAVVGAVAGGVIGASSERRRTYRARRVRHKAYRGYR